MKENRQLRNRACRYEFKVVTIEEVGHYSMLEKPAEFNKKMAEVLKE